MNEAQRIKEAALRLKADDVLQLAFDRAKQEALEALSTADPADQNAILRLQAEIAAIARIRSTLDVMIIQGQTVLRAVR